MQMWDDGSLWPVAFAGIFHSKPAAKVSQHEGGERYRHFRVFIVFFLTFFCSLPTETPFLLYLSYTFNRKHTGAGEDPPGGCP